MRIISENDVRVTIFACVRPSTVSVMKKVLIASMAERLRPSAHQLATQAWCILALYRVRCPQYFAQHTPTCTYAPHSTRKTRM